MRPQAVVAPVGSPLAATLAERAGLAEPTVVAGYVIYPSVAPTPT